MKKYLFRIENLLLLFPLLLLCFHSIFYSNSALDIHLHDTYFVISNAMAFIPVFVGMLMLYFFHFILRVTNKWGGRFCKFHVYATISAYIIIAALSYSMSYSGLAGAPRRYYDYSSWESFSYFSNSNVAIAITFIAFLLLQLIFLIYFILRMLKKGK